MGKNKKTMIDTFYDKAWCYTMPENVRTGQHCYVKFPGGKLQKVIMPKERTDKTLYVPLNNNFSFKEPAFSKVNGELLEKSDIKNSAF